MTDVQNTALAEFESLKRDRNFPAALAAVLKLLKAEPLSAQYLTEAALVCKELGHFSDAADCLKKAIAAGADTKYLRFEHASCLADAGKTEEAEAETRAFLRRNPDDYLFTHLLAVVLKKQKRLEESAELLRLICKSAPAEAEPHRNLGNVYTDLRNTEAAEGMYQKAAELEPASAENWRLLGQAQMARGKYAEAAQSYRACLTLQPLYQDAFVDLIGALCNQRLFDEALRETEARIALHPRDAQAFVGQAWLFKSMGKMDEAVAALEQSLALKPGVTALLMMASFVEFADHPRANDCLRQAVELSGRSIRTLSRLCHSLDHSRYGAEAEHIQEAYDIACEIVDRFPRHTLIGYALAVYGVFLRCADFVRPEALPDTRTLMRYWVDKLKLDPFLGMMSRVRAPEDRLELVQYHREWGQKIEAETARIPLKHTQASARARGKIRIGIMSSDLRNHPVNYFAAPLFDHRDRDRFELYCYSFFQGPEDAAQKSIRERVDAFRLWPHRQDFDVAQGIADDQVDILFELGGPTAMNKIRVLAWKPAPVQASWLGYPHSVGIPGIDYIVVDPFMKPEDPRLLIETPLEMPETWISLGHGRFHDTPAISPGLPQDRNGFITFGTMNNPYKYTPELIAAWAAVMMRVPGSRFLIVRPESGVPAFRANMTREFGRHGIPEDRLAYIPVRGNNMPHYNEIDVALDTFPQSGGTTTCETLWMGVPVVALAGPAVFERLSYSILNNAGLGDLCAFTPEEYIAKAVALAEDRKRREILRAGLRAQIRNSPLGQTERFAQNFYKKIESVLK